MKNKKSSVKETTVDEYEVEKFIEKHPFGWLVLKFVVEFVVLGSISVILTILLYWLNIIENFKLTFLIILILLWFKVFLTENYSKPSEK